MGKRRTFTSTMDAELYQRLKVQAAKEGKSIAEILETLVKAYLESK